LEKLLPKKKVDFVFIDAQKAQYGAYLAKIENIIHDKTVIIIDDVIKYHHKLTSLYRYLSKKQIKCNGKNGRTYTILPLDSDDGIMIIQNVQE
jgi:predicted O-methyltransferase YrrM